MILDQVTIYKDENAYSCFPAIARDASGKLWVSFRRAGQVFSIEALRRGKYDHVDKGARIALACSTDEGQTWASARVLPAFDPECGEQDPSIGALRSGDLLINFFRWRVVPENEQHRLPYPTRRQYDGSISEVEGPWVIRSQDGGVTWEQYPRLVSTSPLARAGTSDAVLELADGTLLMGIYGGDMGGNVSRAYAVRSTDGGYTWSQPALIGRDPAGKISFEEPALACLPDGRLIAMLRSGEPGSYQYLHSSFSEDQGHVWSTPVQTPMWGHPAHMLALPDGRLVCAYGYRRPPYGIRACISADCGQTWQIEREVILREDGGSRDLGYPCTCRLNDGTLLTVYYIHGEDGIRHIAGTRWSLDEEVEMFDWLIRAGKLVDGSGAPWRYADLGITGGKITAIGSLKGAEARQTIDAQGKIVSPGFIDTHSHCDLTLLAGQWVKERLLQGITTEVVGQDGLSYTPASGTRLDEWRRYLLGLNGDFPELPWNWQTAGQFLSLYKNKAANAVYLAPHGALRTEAMGWDDRPATAAELRRMQDLVRRELEEGAAGISTGLTYIPCNHSDLEEMVALCKPVGQAGGILSIHLRSYGGKIHEAIAEAIEIGRQSGAADSISHLRVADPSLWGSAHAILDQLEKARAGGVDVTFDIYPYAFGCAPLFCLLPPWSQANGPDAILKRLRDPETRRKIDADLSALGLDWSLYTLSNASISGGKNWEGFTLPHAAQAAGQGVFEFMMDLLSQTELNTTIVSAGGSEADNVEMFRSPLSMVCSDGVMVGGHPHPRGYGAFPRVIAEYVRRRPVLRLEEAIHKMSGVSAGRLNLNDRGLLRPGAAADVLVFGLDELADTANFREGRSPARGMDWVLVNGTAAVANGQYVAACAGQPQTPLLA